MHSIFKLLPASLLFLYSCGNSSSNDSNEPQTDTMAQTAAPTTETVDISLDSVTLKNYVAYPANRHAESPIILIIPEWWGMNDYVKRRAEQLAGLGYVAMAVDMYGNGYVASNPDEAGTKAKAFYSNPQMGYSRIAAALEKAKTLNSVDASRTGVIGYCFGGAMALNAARQGLPVDAVVSFHGSLKGVPPNKDAMHKLSILVLHGASDQSVKPEEVAAFKKEMDSIGKKYTFKEYGGATHAFTNPDATETGKKYDMPIAYNPAADTASWNEMKEFLQTIFKK